MTPSAVVIHIQPVSVGSRSSEWGLYHDLRHKILKILGVQGQTDKFKILNRSRSKMSPYVLLYQDHHEMFKFYKSAPTLCNFKRLSRLPGIPLSRLRLEVKGRLELRKNTHCTTERAFVIMVSPCDQVAYSFSMLHIYEISLVSQGSRGWNMSSQFGLHLAGGYSNPRMLPFSQGWNPLPFDSIWCLSYAHVFQFLPHVPGSDFLWVMKIGSDLQPWFWPHSFLSLGVFYALHLFPPLSLSLCCLVTFWYFWQIIKVMIINFR